MTKPTMLFTAHPRSVGETYLQHLSFALWFASRLLLAAGAALIHALLPFLFEKTAGRITLQLAGRLQSRH